MVTLDVTALYARIDELEVECRDARVEAAWHARESAARLARIKELQAREAALREALHRVVEQGERVDRDEVSCLDAIMIAEDTARAALAGGQGADGGG